MDNYIAAASFNLLLSSITIVFLGLNMFLDKAFKLQWATFMLAVISVVVTYCIFIFSQTSYFSNLFNIVDPEEEWYPPHIARAISITSLGLFAYPLIAFLGPKNVWPWILTVIFMASVIMYFAAPYLRG